MASRWIAAAVLVSTLAVVATMNGGGYQYGAADQAFYVPAVLRHLDPALFPRDRVLIDSQDRLNLFTPALAAIARAAGLSLPSLFLAGYAISMAGLFVAVLALGRALALSPWAAAGLGVAMTMRHRIARTGANTFEPYFHPRVLAFAIGVWAAVALLRGRRGLAVGLVMLAALVHPTTALWFVLWIGTAWLVGASARQRRWLLGGVAVAGAAAVWALTIGPLAGRLVRMDEEWVTLLAAKDYLFPHQWPWWAWLTSLAYPAVIAAAWRSRRRAGRMVPHEREVVAGALLLFAGLVGWVPLAEARVAIAVQLQVPRVLWVLDLLATAYALWWLADWRRGANGGQEARDAAAAVPGRRWRPGRAAAVAVALAAAAAARGAYVKYVEHPERPLVALDLRADAWRDAMLWLSRRPASANVLADPGHAWRYGSTVRVAAARDVLLDEVKDLSMAMYTREVATRVIERQRAIGDFASLTPGRARELAHRYELDYLVIDRPIDLPLAYRNGRFWIYSLRDPQPSGRSIP